MYAVGDRVRLTRSGNYYGTVWHVKFTNKANKTCLLWHPLRQGVTLAAQWNELEPVD